jgi:hypothetical protein
MLSDGPVKYPEGGKCEDGIYAKQHPLAEQVNGAMSSLILSPIENTVMRDLLGYTNRITGNGGFFNNIMSDTKGRPWKAHEFVVRFFGSPLARQNGFFEWASDDAIQDPDRGFLDPQPIDIYGQELKGEEGTGASMFGTSDGGLPPTIAAWLAKHYRELGTNMEFKTVVTPEGYGSLKVAQEDVARKEAINKEKIESRSKYIEQYIKENFLDHSDANEEELQLAGILRKTIYSDNLFHAGGLGKVPGNMTLEEQATRSVLLGEDVKCCSDINDWDATDGAKPKRARPNEWGAMAQKEAGTNGENWALWASRYFGTGPNDDQEDRLGVRLHSIPDISTSDIIIDYYNYEPTEYGIKEEELINDIESLEGWITALEFVEEVADIDSIAEGAASLLLTPWTFLSRLAVELLADKLADSLGESWKAKKDELEQVQRTIETHGRAVNGYRVSYDYNLFSDEGALRKDGNYRLKVTQVQGISPSGGGASQRDSRRRQDGDGLPPDSLLDEMSTKYDIHDFEVDSVISEEVQEILSALPLSDDVQDSWQIETFYRLVGQEILDKSSNLPKAEQLYDKKEVREYFAGDSFGSSRKFDELSGGFFKRLANRIAIGRSYPEPAANLEDAAEYDDFLAPPEDSSNGEPQSSAEIVMDYIAPAFKFGHDPYEEPEIIYLDNETYGGVLGQLFPDKVPPPFYVKPPDYDGWLGIIENLLPTPNSCEPKSTPFFSLSDLSSLAGTISGGLTEDERMSYDPLCTQEAPYDKIFANITLGNLESVMRSTARLYISAFFLKSMPVITQYAVVDDNFDEGIFEFIVEKMKKGLVYDGSYNWYGLGSTSKEYYYRFLEQVVNNMARKIQSGMLDLNEDLNEEEREAFEIIANKVLVWYDAHEGGLEALSTTAIMGQSIIKKALSGGAADSVAGLSAGSADFDKDSALQAKKDALELAVMETEPQALVFLKRMIREELKVMGPVFNERLLPPIQNIDHLFLLSDTWIRGGLNPDGPLNVTSDPTKSSKYSIPSGEPQSLAEALKELSGVGDFGESLEASLADAKDWPFVLEKYIRIIEKDDPPPSTDRGSNLYGVVNIDDWDTYVRNSRESGNISDFWGEFDLSGETTVIDDHSHDYDIDERGNGTTVEFCDESGICHTHEVINFEVQEAESDSHVHDLSHSAWKFGLRICYLPEKGAQGEFEGAINTVSNDTVMEEKAFRLSSKEGKKYLIPICSAELPIPDQEFTDFDPESYDIYCLIQELIKTPKYQTWFRYVFPLQRYLTTLTIYSHMAFVDAIGNVGYPEEGGDLWETMGGNSARAFRTWDQVLLRRARNKARDAFEGLYETTQNDYSSAAADSPSSPRSILEMLKPLVNFEDGLRWWQRGRRIKRSPYDADGDAC